MNVSEFASLGGKARWKGKTKKDRAAHAKMMVETREKKKVSLLIAPTAPQSEHDSSS